MIKFEKTQVCGLEPAIRGMRNPKNSWDLSDSVFIPKEFCDDEEDLKLANICGGVAPIIKEKDMNLMTILRNAGKDHRKYMRMMIVYVDITAPLYWWKEFDTYKIGTVANSCSTMHKIADKEFTLDDFSHEHLLDDFDVPVDILGTDHTTTSSIEVESMTIDTLNYYREKFLETGDKKYWWQMIQLLGTSYNQKRTIMTNYEMLANAYHSRKHHKLDEWSKGFCEWCESLPYSELITAPTVEEVLREQVRLLCKKNEALVALIEKLEKELDEMKSEMISMKSDYDDCDDYCE